MSSKQELLEQAKKYETYRRTALWGLLTGVVSWLILTLVFHIDLVGLFVGLFQR